jgi:hypothetical protein
MKRAYFLAIAATMALLPGCIISDEVTTVTIRPDGSADLVKFNSNIRSTEQGSKGDEELRQYAEQFDARKNQDFKGIEQAGGKVHDTWWVRREAPYSNIISAWFPSAAALEKWGTIEGEEGQLRLTTHFAQDGGKRKLSMVFLPPKDLRVDDITAPSLKEARQKQANGISEIRLVVLGGQITASRGWAVASDKRSALLALDEIAELLRTSPDRIEALLEWEVNR